MADPTSDLLGALEVPRPLSPELRARLERTLLTPSDELAVTLAGVDGPRPLPSAVRARLETRLAGRGGPVWRRPALLAAAAVVLGLVAGLLALSPSPRTGTPVAQPTAPVSGLVTTPTSTGAPIDSVGTAGGSAAQGLAVSPQPAVLPQRSFASVGGAAAQKPPPAAAGLVAADQAAEVSSVSPAQGPLQGGTRVTLSGRGLSHVVRVEVGGRPATELQVDSDSTVRAVTPARSAPGAVDVVVVLSSGARFGLSPGFSYLPRPVLTALDPASGPMAGGNTVTVTGSGFTASSRVDFDGTAGQVVVVSSTLLRVVAPSHLLGDVDVTVTTAGGTSTTGTASRYRYEP